MHRKINVSLLVIFVLLASAFVSPLKADRIDLYCYLEASTVDVRIEVWEEDKQGNKGPLLWKGVVKQGQRKRINTRTGGIRLASTINVDTNDALSGDNSRWCDSGATIGLP